jgi:uncharacterized repeat protein (TIGR03803 family)
MNACTAEHVGSRGGTTDGAYPNSGLILGTDGNFYGTTAFGGIGAGGFGTVFKVTPDGVETVLYAFSWGSDGGYPAGGVIQASDGNLYGTTTSGGTYDAGIVFKLTLAGVELVLHSFSGSEQTCPCEDGGLPAGLMQGSDGNFYGTTEAGGANGLGTVFKITASGVESVLYSFGATGSMDGATPAAGLIQTSDGSFYGTTVNGGADSLGTMFKLP